jgi:hypothetical protein
MGYLALMLLRTSAKCPPFLSKCKKCCTQVRCASRPKRDSPCILVFTWFGIGRRYTLLLLYAVANIAAFYVFISGYWSNDAQVAFFICATPSPMTSKCTPCARCPNCPHRRGPTRCGLWWPTGSRLLKPFIVQVPIAATGSNAFTDTQTMISLAMVASAAMSFAGLTPIATGTNTLAASTPPDDNRRSVTQVVNPAYSFVDAVLLTRSRCYRLPTPANLLSLLSHLLPAWLSTRRRYARLLDQLFHRSYGRLNDV